MARNRARVVEVSSSSEEERRDLTGKKGDLAKMSDSESISSSDEEERRDLKEMSPDLASESESEEDLPPKKIQPPIRKPKQVVVVSRPSPNTTDSSVNKKKSKGKHIPSKTATLALASSKRPPQADSPNSLREGKRSKRGKHNNNEQEQIPSDLAKQSDSESDHSPPPTLEKHRSFSENRVLSKSKGKNVAFEPTTDALPSGFSSKRLLANSPGEGKDSDSNSNSNSKRAKKKEQGIIEPLVDTSLNKNEDSIKKKPKYKYKRLWSEDDEAILLSGMIKYARKSGVVSSSVDMTGFYEAIKSSLHIDVSKFQMTSKIRKMKRKFETSPMKVKNRDDKVYELSKQIWGTQSTNDVGNLEVVGASRAVLGPSHVGVGRGEHMIIYESNLKQSAKKFEMEEKWKKLKLNEIDVYMQKIDLLRELAVLELEELKSG